MSNADFVVANVYKHLETSVYPRIRRNCEMLCKSLIGAALSYREKMTKGPNAHNFTGNFVNSIIAVMYEDQEPAYAYASYQTGIQPPIQYEMTKARAGHAGKKKRKYHFTVDYSGSESWYVPEVKTDQGFGYQDAEKFVGNYRPKKVGKFVIVLAYTTPYASWIEEQRNSTGICEVETYIRETATKMIAR